jgi:hypothetical protein
MAISQALVTGGSRAQRDSAAAAIRRKTRILAADSSAAVLIRPSGAIRSEASNPSHAKPNATEAYMSISNDGRSAMRQ